MSTTHEQIYKIVSLTLKDGCPVRETARRAEVSPATVSRVMMKARLAGITVKDLESCDADTLCGLICGENPRFAEPDFGDITERMRVRRKMTLLQAWEMLYVPSVPEGMQAYSYKRFCALMAQWRASRGEERRQSHTEIPVERAGYMEIDFSGDPFEWHDVHGARHNARIFVASLRYSKMMFCKAYDREVRDSWIDGIISAFEYFGGVTLNCSMDNAKALVSRPDHYAGEVTAAVRAVCSYYGTRPMTLPVKSPQRKPEAERSANMEQIHVRIPLGLDGPVVAADLSALNRLILEKTEIFNCRPFTDRGGDSRRSLFEREEKGALRPLPLLPYERGIWKVLMADRQYMVKAEGGHRYMVPFQYASSKVAVRIGSAEISFYDPGTMQKLISYPRDLRDGYFRHTCDECLSPDDRELRGGIEGAMEAMKKACQRPSSSVEAFVRAVFEDKSMTALNRVNALRGLKSLIVRHHINIVEKALGTASADGCLTDLNHIRSVLQGMFDAINRRRKTARAAREAGSTEESGNALAHTRLRNA
ncbi:MAG TPA: transposase [Candidatus Avisuccinivibrio pullicola]|nr:transposase [Candidatus Avisuccinivibrio pullicola]